MLFETKIWLIYKLECKINKYMNLQLGDLNQNKFYLNKDKKNQKSKERIKNRKERSHYKK